MTKIQQNKPTIISYLDYYPLLQFPILCLALEPVNYDQHLRRKNLRQGVKFAWVLVPDVSLTLCVAWEDASVALGLKI